MLFDLSQYIKKGILLLITVILIWPVFSSAADRDQVIFSFPKDEKTVFTKNDFQTIKGQISTTKDIQSVQISFDGQVWRDAKFSKNSGGYDFNYYWMVSGKGRFFIMIEAKTTDGALIEGKILSEVYTPPESQEAGLQELLTNYQREQEKKQAKENNKSTTKLSTFTTFEFVSEDYIGSFLENDYMALLPTRQQIEFFMRNTIFVYFFIITYQAGIDIFFLLTLPLLIVSMIGLFVFVYLDYLMEFLDWIYVSLKSNKANVNIPKKAVLFEFRSLHRVSNAKVILENITSRAKKIVTSNRDGEIDLSQVANGEYYYEVQKNNYKPHTIEDISLESFLSLSVAKNNQIAVSEQTQIALPVESDVDLERKKLNEKASLLYVPKNWFLSNTASIITVCILLLILYMIFINIQISLGVMAYMTIAYVIYNKVIKRQTSWGRIYRADNGNLVAGVKIELWKNDQLQEVVWSDFDGKYGFAEQNDGIYFVKIDDRFKMLSQKNYYTGDPIIMDKNICQLKRNILVEVTTN